MPPMAQAPAAPVGGEAPAEQPQGGMAQLASLLAFAPSFNPSVAVNMPWQQKLPFQLGRNFGGDNPYITHGPGFDPTGILGRNWGG
jgi:hypothetical protein